MYYAGLVRGIYPMHVRNGLAIIFFVDFMSKSTTNIYRKSCHQETGSKIIGHEFLSVNAHFMVRLETPI